jgi:hypothetical protein
MRLSILGRSAMSDVTTTLFSPVPNVSFPPFERPDGVPEFKLLVLGTRGAGKTVFISALYNQLKGVSDCPFAIKIDDGQLRSSLIKNFNKVKDPDASWPPANAAVIRYKFHADCRGQSKNINLFDFNYVDYPGSFTIEGGQSVDFNILKEVQNTHSLVVLIDGLSVLRRIKQIDNLSSELYDEINAMSDLFSECAWKPVQFVVTKFDILSGFSMKIVQDVLMESKKLRDFIKFRRANNIPSYLIGVSAIGDKFCDCDPVTGEMKKRSGAQPEPYNLDMVLSFVVDGALLMASRRSPLPQEAGVRKALRLFGFMAGAGAVILGWFRYGALPDPVQFSLITTLQGALLKFKDGATERGDKIDEHLKNTKEVNKLIESIVMAQRQKIGAYVKDNPGCDLLTAAEA